MANPSTGGVWGGPQSADGFEEVCSILSNASLHLVNIDEHMKMWIQ
jgi:hypothetical protein